MPWCSGPQPFWHQRLVSWKATFPQTGKGVGRETGGGAQAVMQAKLPSLPTAHIRLYGQVPNRPRTATSLWSRGWGPLPWWMLKNKKM